jgi:D-alanyl-D-alanine dipeptidase
MKMLVVIGMIIFLSCSFIACNYFAHADANTNTTFVRSIKSPAIKSAEPVKYNHSNFAETPASITATEQSIINAGLVDVKKIDSTIVVDLKYSTTDNFLGVDVYGDFNNCYLQPDVADKLKLAQLFLKSKFPYYSLIVYDAARPRSVQRIMWDTVDVPHQERSKYLSNPQGGSLHNFGAAVDISIIDKDGYVLDMGTPYDFFGELAYPREETRLLNEGKLSYKQLLNRELLRNVMQQAGFWGIATEWWHFNSCSRDMAYVKYKIIE